MMAGDVDAFPNFPAPETLAQFKADPRFAVVIGTTEGETILAMNNGKKPFDDLKVRQAMSYAIDRKAIIDGAMFGYGTPIGSHFSPADPGYVDLTGLYAYDPDKAKELLKEAGYPDGFKVTLKLPPPSYARRGGEIIAAAAQGGRHRGRDHPGRMGAVAVRRVQEQGLRPDHRLAHRAGGLSASMPATTTISTTTRTPSRRSWTSSTWRPTRPSATRCIGDIQKKIADDAVNVFLFELAKTGVWNAKLKGLWANSPIQANDLTEVYWED